MQTEIQVRLTPSESAHGPSLLKAISQITGEAETSITGYQILKKSIDARSRQQIWVNLTLIAFIKEPISKRFIEPLLFPSLPSNAKDVIIIGAGPAGLFAALECIQLGLRPIIIERGKDVRARRRDLASLNKEGIVNRESNYCFGEGGAGTYSDGKLYTRSNKRGNIKKILQTLVYHGANPEILIDAHPHIGTNKLPQLIENIRERILFFGGEVRFNTKLIDFEIKENSVSAITLMKEAIEFIEPIQNMILATGHSARDIYELLNSKKLSLEPKPFAIGIRVEHPQSLIDGIQYHCGNLKEVMTTREFLPAASYSLVHQTKNHGVYSFCMCPGGIIAPCATNQEEVVTNGWSPSKRNNPFANSGIVVGLELKDFELYKEHGALAGLEFQKQIERQAWIFGGKTQSAPAQRLEDFTQDKISTNLPNCSYQPGLTSVNIKDVVGKTISPLLKEGLKAFGIKMRGFMTNEAIVVGVESRTSTPVRIPRDKDLFYHPQLHNLFPCGEGAGYAGGIVSAAMDGESCINSINY